MHPYFDSTDLREYLSLTKPTISKIINELINLNIISSLDNKQRYVKYYFKDYVGILEKGAEL